jgi:hypothetical protein
LQISYCTKLNDIKQHGASPSNNNIDNKHPYAGFRSVPEFHKASVDQSELANKLAKKFTDLQKEVFKRLVLDCILQRLTAEESLKYINTKLRGKYNLEVGLVMFIDF